MRIVNWFRLGSESNESLESLIKTLYDSTVNKHTLLANL